MTKSLALFLVAFALSAGALRAEIFLSEAFNYPDGDITAAPGSAWSNLGGATPAEVVSGQLRLTGGNSADIVAPLAGGPISAGDPRPIYTSFLLRVTSAPGVSGNYFAHFFDPNAGVGNSAAARIWISSTNAIDGGIVGNNRFRVGIGNGVSSVASSGPWPTTLAANSNYFVLTRYIPATGFATLWINPVAESDPSVTAADLGTPEHPNSISVAALAFRQTPGIGVLSIDDLRVGETFVDVSPAHGMPRIAGLTPLQSIAANHPTPPLSFLVGVAAGSLDRLVVSGYSSNPALIPDDNIALEGTGSNRTIIITPAPGAQGFANVTVAVGDEFGASVHQTVRVAVGVPTLSMIPNVITTMNVPAGPVPFEVNDTETPENLVVTAASSNLRLLPNANIVLSGTDADRAVFMTPAFGESGLAIVSVQVSDGISSSSNRFFLTVSPHLEWSVADNFDRADGPLIDAAGPWTSNGGLGGTNAHQLQVAGQGIRLTEEQSEDVSVDLPPGRIPSNVYSPTGGVVFYARFTVRVLDLPTPSGSFIAHFAESAGSGFRGRLFVSTSNAARGHYRFGVANAANGLIAAAQFPEDIATNVTQTVVLRYNVATGESRLWVNPVSAASFGVDAVDAPSPGPIRNFIFRQASGIGGLLVDDFKLGTEFSGLSAASYRLVVAAIEVGRVQIRWPAEAVGFVLQSAASPRGEWTPELEQGTVRAEEKVAEIEAATSARFFRLFRP